MTVYYRYDVPFPIWGLTKMWTQKQDLQLARHSSMQLVPCCCAHLITYRAVIGDNTFKLTLQGVCQLAALTALTTSVKSLLIHSLTFRMLFLRLLFTATGLVSAIRTVFLTEVEFLSKVSN